MNTVTIKELNHDLRQRITVLHVKPNRIVQLPYQHKKILNPHTLILANEKRKLLREQKAIEKKASPEINNKLSIKAKQRLQNAINWLVASAEKKEVFDFQTKKSYPHKVSFITLTLPYIDNEHDDIFFKRVLLHNFLSTAQKKFGLNSYVWKVEAQKNGNIHAHIVTDVFIHWRELRNTWNSILIKHGVMLKYTDKFSKMSFNEYHEHCCSNGRKSEIANKKSYNEGVKFSWQNPNSTDVKNVRNVNNLSAYIAKYFSKDDIKKRPIQGRLWGCSYNLGKSANLSIELVNETKGEVINQLAASGLECVSLETVNKTTGDIFEFGLLYKIAQNDWGKKITGDLFDLYRNHLLAIRNAINGSKLIMLDI